MSTDKKLIITAAVLLILMGIVGAVSEYREAAMPGYGMDNNVFYDNGTSTGSDSDTNVVCTMEAKECPDGSYVGRTGPHCEFVCPTTDSTATSTAGGGPLLTGELVGTVMLGPTCPVVQNPPSAQCADKPYRTTVTVSINGREVGRQETDGQGRFMFSFLPGTYTVSALGGSTLPRCESKTITLTKAATTTIALSCDSGIR